MATTLGKRKRRSVETTKEYSREGSEDYGSSELDAQEIFRRHFEAKFKPLPVVKKVENVVEEGSEDDSEEESDWDGISDGEQGAVQVVEHSDAQTRAALMSKEDLKAFMSSKPPLSSTTTTLLQSKTSTAPEDDASEAANLKKDLELQRFLKESHLLESSTDHIVSGKNRHKATDLRLQALGSKTSILKQEKMPMLHRRGIIAKQSDKEEKRRKEARENGIILEKAKMGVKKGSDGRRDRGVGAPGVGKFSGGTLKLSKKDIFEIEGPRKSASGRGGRGGGKGRGKRGR